MQRLLFLLVVSTLALPASADFYSHRYAGVSFSNTDLDGFCEGGEAFIARNNVPGQSLTAAGCGDSGDGWKIYSGWRWTPYLAVEGSYQQLSEANLDFEYRNDDSEHLFIQDEIKTQLGNAFIVGHWPLMESLSLFGKLGGGFWMSEFSERQSGEVLYIVPVSEEEFILELGPYSAKFSDSESGFHWGYGVGVSYIHQNRWSIRAEWESFSDIGTEEFRGEFDVQSASLGWSMHF
jgi:opacity protein-like surface antigen